MKVENQPTCMVSSVSGTISDRADPLLDQYGRDGDVREGTLTARSRVLLLRKYILRALHLFRRSHGIAFIFGWAFIPAKLVILPSSPCEMEDLAVFCGIWWCKIKQLLLI